MDLQALSPRRPPTPLLLVAAAGYGKTAVLESEVSEGATYCRAGDLAPELGKSASLLSAAGPRPPHVLIDDLCQLPMPEQQSLLRAVAALPADVRVTLASRRPLDPETRACFRVPVFERGPADLALTPAAVAGVLRHEHGVTDVGHAVDVHSLTAGWPALVHFAGDALAQESDDPLSALSEPETAAASWIHDQVLADLPPPVARVLALAADLDPLSEDLMAGLAEAAGLSGGREAFRWLRRTGLLVSHPRHSPRAGRQPVQLVPVVAEVFARGGGCRADGAPPVASGQRLALAAQWYGAQGYPAAAAAVLARAGHPVDSAALIESRSEEMLAAGGAADVVRLLQDVTPAGRGPALQRILADAQRMSGDVSAAQRTFAPLLAQADATGSWDAGLAWRAAMVHYLRGDYRWALETLDQAPVAPAARTRDDIEVMACRASVLAMLGAAQEAASVAATCVTAAEALGDHRAAAAAHLAAAKSSVASRREAHLCQALAAAERAGDVVQAARVLGNQAHGLLTEARYREAATVAAEAVRAAERGSPPGILVTALHNLGEALGRLGQYSEAILHFRRSVSICRRLGLERAAMGVWALAEIHRQLGQQEQSRAAFSEAVTLARSTAEVQVLVPALAGLARLLADSPADLPRARSAAAEAEALAPPSLVSCAAGALAWAALADGDHSGAQEHAARAMAAARAAGAAAALAESLELTAAVARDPSEAQAALQEALSIWTGGGAEPAADRVLVLLGRLPAADGAARAAAREAAKRLLRRGVRAVNGLPLHSPEGAAAAVDIRVLGNFEVRVGGQPVPQPAWRSKQARTLVKILTARRGRHVPRSELCELLWPDEEPARTAHRLSVLASVVRSVLDPERTCPPDYYLSAALSGLFLQVRHVTVDVEHLLQDAAHAASLLRAGKPEQAQDILTEVDSRYRGDAFLDEPYEPWADGLREEARAAWLNSLRRLVKLLRNAGEHSAADSLLVRLLAADPYDEEAHRALVDVLVRAGRHGEARRAFERWSAAMRSIEAPLPDPAVLRRRARPAPPRTHRPVSVPSGRVPVTP